jgi:uncharacterized protein (DUF58 family)
MVLLIAVFGLSGALALLHGGTSLWGLFHVSGGLLAAVALQGAALRAVRAERTADVRLVAAGGEVRVTVRLQLRRFLPVLWLAIEEPWTRQGRPFAVRRRFLVSGFRAELAYSYPLSGLARGVYEADELAVYTGDLFGFCTRRLAISAPVRFAAHPRPTAVPFVPVRPERPDGYGIGGIRDYREGDPLNRIHWKASAAVGRWMTKLPEADAEERILLAVDGGFPDEAHLERALEAATGYALAAWGRGCGVEVDVCGTGSRASGARTGGTGTSAAADRTQGPAPVLELLARCEPAGDAVRDEGQAEAWLAHLGRRARARMRLVIVTARLDAARVGAMERLAKGGVRLGVLWVTEASVAGGSGGVMSGDAEGGSDGVPPDMSPGGSLGGPQRSGRVERLYGLGVRVDKIALRPASEEKARKGGGRRGAKPA